MVTIDSIVRSALSARGEESLHKYQRFLQFALQAAADFYMDSAGSVKTVKLPMNDLKQVELPLDYIDWVKVGIATGDRVKVFGTNDKLPIMVDKDDCGNVKKYEGGSVGLNELPVNFFNYGGYSFLNYINEYGEYIGGLYGVGGGYTDDGYYRVIKNQGENGIIQFNSQVNNTDVYLEYISSGFEPHTETKVHEYAKNAIEFYIHWRIWMHKDGPASANAQGARKEYFDELHKARRRMMDLTPRDILEISRNEYTQTPKY
jgi:hypothetical protein